MITIVIIRVMCGMVSLVQALRLHTLSDGSGWVVVIDISAALHYSNFHRRGLFIMPKAS